MKKLSLIFLSLMLAIVAAAGITLTACENNGEKLDYTVTVLSDDEETGIKDITVKWADSSVKGTAVTGEDGTATASIVAGTYDVTLENLPEGFTYTPATVTSAIRGITITLKKAEVDYVVTVNQFNGKPAENVKVSWAADNVTVQTATTGADGKASIKLEYGNYSVSVSNLPADNFYIGLIEVTGANPEAIFNLESGDTIDYFVTVKSEGGLKFTGYTVTALSGSTVAATATTDETTGIAKFNLPSDASYSVRVQNVPDGYTYSPVTISKQNNEVELILRSQVIADISSATLYTVGDIIHDYEFTTPYLVDGKAITYKISELLKTKEVILLNFWGTNCSACMQEMPAMQQAYEMYSDRVEFLAVSNYMGGDTAATIENFRGNNNYTFPMFRDTYSFTSKFLLSAWPTTVIIDRYGAIARIEEGALVNVSYWQKLLDKYVGDDYVQTFKPGEKAPPITDYEKPTDEVKAEAGKADHYDKIAAAINNKGTFAEGCSVVWYGEPEETAEYTWPFLLKTLDDGTTVLYPSNTGHEPSFSFIYADITMTSGKVLAFDYWLQSENDNDNFYILWDEKVIYQLSGVNEGWNTCYVHVDVLKSSHQLVFSYLKDADYSLGFDSVYIKNLHFAEISELPDGTNILRGAAYGTPAEGSNVFPNYATVEKREDGYYYVDLSSISGSEYAGNDNSPMLFASFAAATNWNSLSIVELLAAKDENTGADKYDFTFAYNGKTEDQRTLLTNYASLAGKSDINGYLPVDEDLKDLLTAFTAHISGNKAHSNEWLELCYFYSHYGSGEPYGNPIIGLTEKTALVIEADKTYTADLTRLIAPYPETIYAFTPDRSGVYNFKSFIPENVAEIFGAQLWVYTDPSDPNRRHALVYSGSERMNRDATNEQNFDEYLYLTAGQKYYVAVSFLMTERGTYDFKISYVGESATKLVPCASGVYTQDENNILHVAYAVGYEKDDDGYYHALNSDGTRGDFIWIDFKYETLGYIFYPLSTAINQWYMMPQSDEKVCKTFDFSKTVSYIPYSVDEEGNTVYNYGELDLSSLGEQYKDYTEIMQAFCDEALKGNGLLKVTDELVAILDIFSSLRTQSTINGIVPDPVENEWLKFCWYYKVINESNPV